MIFRFRKRKWTIDELPVIRSATGKRYKDFRLGETCWEDRTVSILGSLRSQHKLDTIVHELIHVAFGPYMPEGPIKEAGELIAKVLWRLGYRQVNQDDPKI